MAVDVDKLLDIPNIQIFAACNNVIHDQYTQQKSLIGLFDNFITDAFPLKHHGCAIYVAISGGSGTIPVMLKMINLTTLESVVIGQEAWKVVDPVAPSPPLVFWIAPEFKGPGVYCFELSVNAQGTKHHGHVIGTKRFTVRQINATMTRPKL